MPAKKDRKPGGASSKHRASTSKKALDKAAAYTRKKAAIDAAAQNSAKATHAVRVNVLGLAGITVNRQKCRDITRDASNPMPPENMRAVIAFSKGENIRGITSLSKPLLRSPNDDVVIPENENISVRHSAKHNTSKLQRHVAVWSGNNESSLGSLVTFGIRLSENKKPGTSGRFAPQKMDLLVALAEDSESESKIALPFGVARLEIGGDETSGDLIVMDLPVASISESKPPEPGQNSARYNLIALKPKSDGSKKKGGIKRLLGRDANDQANIPSEKERQAFDRAYATDASGDAVVRVQLQVVELETPASNPVAVGGPVGTSASAAKNLHGKSVLANTTDETAVKRLAQQRLQADAIESVSSRGSESSGDSVASDDESAQSYISDAESSQYSVETDEGTLETADDPISKLKSGYNNAPFDQDDDYTLSFEKKNHSAQTAFPSVQLFGRTVRLPNWGPIGVRETEDGQHKTQFMNDDMTEVSAEMFGRSFRLPICSSLKPVDFDEESFLDLDLHRTFSSQDSVGSIVDSKRKKLLGAFLRASKEGGEKSLLDSNIKKDAGPQKDDGNSEVGTFKADASVVNPGIEQKAKGSPRGVADVLEKSSDRLDDDTVEEKHEISKSKSLSNTISDMFACAPSDTEGFEEQDDADTVPGSLVIPADNESVGELTQTTHELKLAKGKQNKNADESVPLPVAFGGKGMCMSTDLDNTLSFDHAEESTGPRVHQDHKSSNSVIEEEKKVDECDKIPDDTNRDRHESNLSKNVPEETELGMEVDQMVHEIETSNTRQRPGALQGQVAQVSANLQHRTVDMRRSSTAPNSDNHETTPGSVLAQIALEKASVGATSNEGNKFVRNSDASVTIRAPSSAQNGASRAMNAARRLVSPRAISRRESSRISK